MPSQIELIAYLAVLILCIIAFVKVARAYQISERKLAAYDIIDLAKIFMITFGFIIIKLTIDYIFILDYLSAATYKIVSFIITIIIIVGILYSVRLLIDLTKKV